MEDWGWSSSKSRPIAQCPGFFARLPSHGNKSKKHIVLRRVIPFFSIYFLSFISGCPRCPLRHSISYQHACKHHQLAMLISIGTQLITFVNSIDGWNFHAFIAGATTMLQVVSRFMRSLCMLICIGKSQEKCHLFAVLLQCSCYLASNHLMYNTYDRQLAL